MQHTCCTVYILLLTSEYVPLAIHRISRMMPDFKTDGRVGCRGVFLGWLSYLAYSSSAPPRQHQGATNTTRQPVLRPDIIVKRYMLWTAKVAELWDGGSISRSFLGFVVGCVSVVCIVGTFEDYSHRHVRLGTINTVVCASRHHSRNIDERRGG